MYGTTVSCNYFICVTMPTSLSHLLNPFSFKIILQEVLFHIVFISYHFIAPVLGSMFYLFRLFCINSAIKSIAWQLFLLFSIKKASACLSWVSWSVWTEKSHINLQFLLSVNASCLCSLIFYIFCKSTKGSMFWIGSFCVYTPSGLACYIRQWHYWPSVPLHFLHLLFSLILPIFAIMLLLLSLSPLFLLCYFVIYLIRDNSTVFNKLKTLSVNTGQLG